jgi:hypothetical protein
MAEAEAAGVEAGAGAEVAAVVEEVMKKKVLE